jgi:hypothetical protein
MKTTKLCCALIGAAALLTASNALAVINGTLTTTSATGYGVGNYGNNNGGGAFLVKTTGALGTGSFYTFCLEDNESIAFPATYNYQINSGAINGGISYSPTAGASSTFDPICIGTAWLYSQFRNGTLTGYNTAAGANNLQWAIWYLEGEKFSTGDLQTPSVDAVAYLNLACAALGYASGDYFDLMTHNANGAYGVVALNLTDSNGGRIQDVLAIVPEPSTVVAGALLLLPFGVSTLRILRKKQA